MSFQSCRLKNETIVVLSMRKPHGAEWTAIGLVMFILCALAPLPRAVADSEIRSCSGYKNIRFVGLADYNRKYAQDETANKYDCRDFEQFDVLGGSLNELIGITNPYINLIPVNKMIEAKDDYIFDHLSIGFNRRSSDDVRAAQIIFAHEWSHSLLNQSLIDHLSIFEPVRKLRATLASAPLILRFVNLVEKDGSCKSAACLSFVRDNTVALQASNEANLKLNEFYKSSEAELFLVVASHYQELFADIVPALYFEDPQIIKAADDYVQKNEVNRSATDCRSFEFAAPENFSTTDPHCSFSSVRKPLWEKMKFAKTTEKKRYHLLRVLSAIEKQIQVQYARVSQMSPERRKLFPDTEAKLALSKEFQKL